ncbi:histidinol-phosphatase HisJ family protein [Alkaliphilus serpentinus]|uniref:Histidinol-phosphatase n=1 Tax=Alkaliphilus serpentinus TaxID=1482731 RepID=A0A833HN32_9FIRM|nr:histidinol-phosphatase HisJ family protein [Alkaliphilus serpentinus]KAB3529041.1 histidinol-phosphatase HisJ family protein [Alkaliphilus serpentinus]
MFDYHIHTHFSPDSAMSMKEAIIAAIDKGLNEITITDHLDFDYNGKGSHIEFVIEDYFKAIANYQEEFKSVIKIKTGIELGLQPHLTEAYRRVINSHPFDFAIASIHSVEKTDLYMGNYFQKKTQQEAYHIYFKELYEVVNLFDSFTVLGHLDVIKRYGAYDVPLPLEDFREVTSLILNKIIEKGKGIELNTSGIRYQVGDYHPSLEVFKLYHSLGGEIISLGSDAHSTHHLAFDFNNALRALKEIGFQYICTFEKMKPIYHKIDEIL